MLHISLKAKDKIDLHPFQEVRGLSFRHGFEEIKRVDHQTDRILSKFLYQRNPEWVSLYSPYRPNQDPVTLHDVHLSTWFANQI